MVLLGDDSASTVDRIGSIQVNMHDGMIRELVDIRYIPTLPKNLIYLSMVYGGT